MYKQQVRTRAAHLHETIVEVLLLLTEEFVIPMADSEEDISDTDHEQQPVPSPKRAKVIDGQQSSIKKFTGAAAYKSGFQACWQKRWPCIKPVKDDPHSFHCTVCFKAVSCGHQGERM